MKRETMTKILHITEEDAKVYRDFAWLVGNGRWIVELDPEKDGTTLDALERIAAAEAEFVFTAADGTVTRTPGIRPELSVDKKHGTVSVDSPLLLINEAREICKGETLIEGGEATRLNF